MSAALYVKEKLGMQGKANTYKYDGVIFSPLHLPLGEEG
jgi:hypothetical protein